MIMRRPPLRFDKERIALHAVDDPLLQIQWRGSMPVPFNQQRLGAEAPDGKEFR